VRAATRKKAKEAYSKLAEVYHLLDDLMKELSSREDFAGYLLAQDARQMIFGSGVGTDALTKLGAIASLGERSKGEKEKS